MHIPEDNETVSPLYLATYKKNNFHWGPEQQEAFTQGDTCLSNQHKFRWIITAMEAP